FEPDQATIIVSKYSAVPTADASDKRQQSNPTPSTPTNVVADLSPLIIQTTPKHTIQAPTQTLTATADENNNQAEVYIENAHVNEDKFINIFSTPVFEERESSSRHVDPSNMHTFYQRHPSEHH
ncbi:hypothetical protein Tco_1551753, partial [Tanacetum coccineum]